MRMSISPHQGRRAKDRSLLVDDPTDAFLHYSLAMELDKAQEHEQSLVHFRSLMAAAPPYVPAFFMAAQQLTRLGRTAEARDALRDGIERARAAGDTHAAGEMSEFLACSAHSANKAPLAARTPTRSASEGPSFRRHSANKAPARRARRRDPKRQRGSLVSAAGVPNRLAAIIATTVPLFSRLPCRGRYAMAAPRDRSDRAGRTVCAGPSRHLSARRLQRDPAPPGVPRPALRGPRLGRRQQQGYAEAYKEVIHEDAHQDRRAHQGPRLLFPRRRRAASSSSRPRSRRSTSAKPSSPAYQLRRYAWSAKLPVSILTDFEEFAVYDCRISPAKTDKAVDRPRHLPHCTRVRRALGRDWPACSRRRRSAAARSTSSSPAKKVKKGTAEVDAAFLEEIESWRDELARNLALRNPDALASAT